ncbi:unnamed protein product, partial [Ectocarpus sp. 4 AP-2014]
MENDGVVSASADPSPSLGEVPAVVEETIGGSVEQEDPAAAASTVVDEEGDDGPAAAEEDGEGEGISDDEEASGRRRGKGGEEEEEGEEEGGRVVKDPPYEYPTGLVEIDEQELAPAGNIYDSWTATPGVTGEALDNVTLTLKFEAMGAQDLTVGLAYKSGGKGGMYQLIIGNKGNLQVDLEKIQQGRRGETVASSAGLLCASKRAHRYWVAVKHGRLDFGVGDVCGQRTVLSHQDKESPIEVRYVGFTCLRHRAVFRDIKMEAEAGTGPLGSAVETELEFVRAEGCDEGFSGEDKESLDAALEQYRQECENMKRRARKFGGAYSPPFLQDWVPWTLVKRLSWNRDAPMDGGIDRESKEEREKQKLRAERFGGPEAEPPSSQDLQNPLAATVDPDVVE